MISSTKNEKKGIRWGRGGVGEVCGGDKEEEQDHEGEEQKEEL